MELSKGDALLIAALLARLEGTPPVEGGGEDAGGGDGGYGAWEEDELLDQLIGRYSQCYDFAQVVPPADGSGKEQHLDETVFLRLFEQLVRVRFVRGFAQLPSEEAQLRVVQAMRLLLRDVACQAIFVRMGAMGALARLLASETHAHFSSVDLPHLNMEKLAEMSSIMKVRPHTAAAADGQTPRTRH